VTFLDVPVLTGRWVRLEPIGQEHADDLAKAVAVDDLWQKWTTRVPAPEDVPADIEARLAKQARGEMVPWATCRADTGEAVGATSYCNLDPANLRLEIGHTWIGKQAQRSQVNAEAKLLQLTRAFEVLGCNAVEFRTHWHNRQSRAAIERLGAKQDGVLRNHQVWRDGTLRDTVVYSITASEWPAVRLGLENRLRS
jgi:RimJ/RimL family protein N-acetyltransferase